MKIDIEAAQERVIQNPLDAEALCELGRACVERGQLDRAMDCVAQAVASESTNASFHCVMGDLLWMSGRLTEAICAYRQALQIDPGCTTALTGLGLLYLERREADMAASCLRRAVELAPEDPSRRCNLVRALNQQCDFVGGQAEAKRALAQDPHSVTARFRLVEALTGLGWFEEAMQELRQVADEQPSCGEAYGTMAQHLNNLNFQDEVPALCQRALSLVPRHPAVHFELASYALATGDWETGWREYEWRFYMPGQRMDHIRFSQPLAEPVWNGENLDGKTLFVHAEQGLGDTIQFVRFVPELAKLNCRLILLVQPELVTLLQCLANIARVLPYRASVPRHDYQIALCSIPRALGIRMETLPRRVPYLSAPTSTESSAVIDTDAKLRVGFVWATKPLTYTDQRSVPLACVAKLFDVESVAFYSLQINEKARELEPYLTKGNVHTLHTFIKDMRDTAYFVSKLDLIITIDTSIAHLAGALGARVWVLLPFSASWRWLKRDPQSPWHRNCLWYPTMTLFRSVRFNDWEVVLDQVKQELIDLLAEPTKHELQPVQVVGARGTL